MEDAKSYWNIRAKSFLGHREEDPYQIKMTGLMEENGAVFENKTVIDIGCGSGAFTIRFARKAKKVTAFDISDVMLENVRKAAEGYGLTNIEYVNGDWAEYTPQTKWDIVFVSLSPAIKDEAAIEKMRKYASEWFVNIYFAGPPMKAHVVDGLLKLHGCEKMLGKTKKGSMKMQPLLKEYLEKRSIPYKCLPVSGVWVNSRTKEQMINNCVDILQSRGTEPKMDIINEYIEQFHDKETDKYISKTDYSVEMILWNVK